MLGDVSGIGALRTALERTNANLELVLAELQAMNRERLGAVVGELQDVKQLLADVLERQP